MCAYVPAYDDCARGGQQWKMSKWAFETTSTWSDADTDLFVGV